MRPVKPRATPAAALRHEAVERLSAAVERAGLRVGMSVRAVLGLLLVVVLVICVLGFRVLRAEQRAAPRPIPTAGLSTSDVGTGPGAVAATGVGRPLGSVTAPAPPLTVARLVLRRVVPARQRRRAVCDRACGRAGAAAGCRAARARRKGAAGGGRCGRSAARSRAGWGEHGAAGARRRAGGGSAARARHPRRSPVHPRLRRWRQRVTWLVCGGQSTGRVVDLNTAQLSDLDALPGRRARAALSASSTGVRPTAGSRASTSWVR
jgi:hypothetical protein